MHLYKYISICIYKLIIMKMYRHVYICISRYVNMYIYIWYQTQIFSNFL